MYLLTRNSSAPTTRQPPRSGPTSRRSRRPVAHPPAFRRTSDGERTQDERQPEQTRIERLRRDRSCRASRPAMPQSAAATSPFTPIANYGFLSDCHTGALVAPDGAVDWLCVPRFDSSSVFGALLDRGAGSFRFGPFGINVPSDRIYEPGTNSLVTSWKTPTGWVVVRDALTMGPRRREGCGHTPHQTTRRRGRRPRAGTDRHVHRRDGRDRSGVRAGVRLRPRPRHVDAERG